MTSLKSIQGIDIYLLDQFLKGRLIKGMKVFDAGCGYGRNIRWLISEGHHVTAMDANPEPIAHLCAEFPESRDRFFVDRIENLSLEQQFDFVICNAVLHFAGGHAHFETMFCRLVELLNPGGILFIRMTSSIGLEDIIGLEDKVGNGNEGVYVLPDGSTRYLLTRPKVDALSKQYGLDLVEPVKTVFVDGLRSMTTLVFSPK